MPAPELRIANRTAYFRKAITAPDFESDRVLVRDAFEFAGLWLRRNCKDAVPYWTQARAYFEASKYLPHASAPLTSYYCFLNAAKALLTVKGIPTAERHGVGGSFEASRRALSNEVVSFQNAGVMAELSRYLREDEPQAEHRLTHILSNLPFIHRAYRYTYRSHPEMFVPLRQVVYRKHPNEARTWVTAIVEGRYADARSLRTLPERYELDTGYTDKTVIRTHRRVRWVERGENRSAQSAALARLYNYHRQCRLELAYISASPDLWYLKRSVANTHPIRRFGLTLVMAAMHRLSELARYDPKGLSSYLEGKENWLLAEFIELSPQQFIDELVCEMTNLEFGLPGIRPRTT